MSRIIERSDGRSYKPKRALVEQSLQDAKEALLRLRIDAAVCELRGNRLELAELALRTWRTEETIATCRKILG
jgi:hypothetical protein